MTVRPTLRNAVRVAADTSQPPLVIRFEGDPGAELCERSVELTFSLAVDRTRQSKNWEDTEGADTDAIVIGSLLPWPCPTTHTLSRGRPQPRGRATRFIRGQQTREAHGYDAEVHRRVGTERLDRDETRPRSSSENDGQLDSTGRRRRAIGSRSAGAAIEEPVSMDLCLRSSVWRTGAEVMLLAALVTGCIPVPVPVPDTNPRYSKAQLDVVGREATTATSIRAELGPPDLTRDDGRIWIYTWHKVSGMFIDVPIWTDDPASPGGEIVSKQYLLVLEFDADGNLQGEEFAEEAPHSGHRPYCTRSGLCVAGEVSTSDETFGYVRVFEDQSSTVTAKGQARERVTPDWNRKATNVC